MLRPAKLFHSFHQLRHYVQTKVTELVVQHPPPPFLLPPTATPTSSNGLTHGTYSTKVLAHGLERQVVTKPCGVFSRSAVLGSWRPAVSPAGGSIWHRGIGLHNNGYHGLGAFRSYSNSATPFVKNFAPSPNGSVFNYISSGVFAPISTHTGGKGYSTPSPVLRQQRLSQDIDTIDKSNTHPLLNERFLTNSNATKATPTDEPTTAAAAAAAASTMILNKDDILAKATLEKTNHVSTLTTYFFITLDLVPMTATQSIFNPENSCNIKPWKPWTKEVLPRLLDWKTKQQQHYDRLLDWLQLCLDKGCHVQQIGTSLRLYLPKHLIERGQAMAWLDAIGNTGLILDQDWLLEEETISVEEPLVPLGPDYFQGIYLFLSHIDDLVDQGPAFAHSSWSM